MPVVRSTTRQDRRQINYAILTSGLCSVVWVIIVVQLQNQRHIIDSGCQFLLCCEEKTMCNQAHSKNITCHDQYVFEQYLQTVQRSTETSKLASSNIIEKFSPLFCIIKSIY